MLDMNLLAPISADAPCGLDLEYDPEFLALERSLEAAYAERIVGPEGEAVGPDWRQVAEQAMAVSARSRDLRVCVTLTRAWLHLEGLAGLARGTALLRGLLEEHWSSVHPQIGAQGDTTGLMRVAALRNLCDARSVIAPLRATPLVRALGLPTLSLRDLQNVHANKAAPTGSLDAAQIDAVFRGCDPAALGCVYRAALAARTDLTAIEAMFTDHMGSELLRLSDLIAQLDAIDAYLAPRLAACEAARDDAETAAAHPQAARSPRAGLAAASPGGGVRAQLGAADSAAHGRADVVRELERLCAYFEENEPSSPIPLLLNRAKRLAGMRFVDIVRELAPGGMSEITTLRGPTTTEES